MSLRNINRAYFIFPKCFSGTYLQEKAVINVHGLYLKM